MTKKPDSKAPSTGQARSKGAVVCWETGEVFESCGAAAAKIGVVAPAVYGAIRRKGTSGGFHWYWARGPRPESFAPRKRSGGKGRPKRAVVCWETGEVYSCAQEAAEAVGLKTQSSICAAAKKRSSAGGYRWYYQGEPKPDEAELKKPGPSRPRAVVCWETGEVYPSIATATAAMGIKNRTGISQAAAKGVMANGFHWYWADQPKPDASQLRPEKKARRAVVCWETGEVFENSAAAAAKAGVDPTKITDAVRRRGRCGGFHWYWADGPKPDASQMKPATRAKRPVTCWETGEVFENTDAAASRVGATCSSITEAIRRKGATGGYHWYWADQPKPDESELKSRWARKRARARERAAEAEAAACAERAKAADAAPESTPSAFEASVRWSTFFGSVVEDFGRRCKERSGLTATQTRLLFGFALFPNTPVSYIADMLMIKRSAAGYTLGELEKKGLVVPLAYRRTHPAELTLEGGLCLLTYVESLFDTVDELLGHLTAPQRAELLGLMGREFGDWKDALESWVEAFSKARDAGALVSASLALENMCAFAALEKTHARSMGLPASEMRAVHLLAASPAPMKVGELCARARLGTKERTMALAKLRESGIIECNRSRKDRRVTEAALSAAGSELVERTSDEYVELFEASFPGLAGTSPQQFGIAEYA